MAKTLDDAALRAAEDSVSAAVTDALHAAKALPADCRYICSVVIGPDGKPSYQCRVECDW